MFSEDVTTGNGVVKHVVAQSQEELDEAVKVAKDEQLAPAPDIHNPKDGNKIVSPDNLHTEPAFVQPEEPETPQAPAPEEFEEPKKKSKK